MGPGRGPATPGGAGRSCCSRPTAAGTRGRRSESSAQSRGCLVLRSSKPPATIGAGRPSPGSPGSGAAGGDKRPHVAVHPPDLFRVDHLSAHTDFSGAIVRSMKLSRCLSVSTVVFGLIFAGCAGVKPMASGGTGGSGNGSGKGGGNGTGGRFIHRRGRRRPRQCHHDMRQLDARSRREMRRRKQDGRRRLHAALPDRKWLDLSDGRFRPALATTSAATASLNSPEACDDGNKNSRRRLLGRLQRGRDRLACPRAGEALHPALRRRRHRGQENCDDSNTDQRRRLLQHLPGGARLDLPDDSPEPRWPGSAPSPSAATA